MKEITFNGPWDQALHDGAYAFWRMGVQSTAQILGKPSVLVRLGIALVLGVATAELLLIAPIGPVGVTHFLAVLIGALAAHIYMLIVATIERRKSMAFVQAQIAEQVYPKTLLINAGGHHWFYSSHDTRYDWDVIDDVAVFAGGIAMRMDDRVATLPAGSFPDGMTAEQIVDQISEWRGVRQ